MVYGPATSKAVPDLLHVKKDVNVKLEEKMSLVVYYYNTHIIILNYYYTLVFLSPSALSLSHTLNTPVTLSSPTEEALPRGFAHCIQDLDCSHRFLLLQP